MYFLTEGLTTSKLTKALGKLGMPEGDRYELPTSRKAFPTKAIPAGSRKPESFPAKIIREETIDEEIHS
jgi:hypothetical protein